MAKLLPEIGDWDHERGVCTRVEASVKHGMLRRRKTFEVTCEYQDPIPVDQMKLGTFYWCQKYGTVLFVQEARGDLLPVFAVLDEEGSPEFKYINDDSQVNNPKLRMIPNRVQAWPGRAD